MFPYFAFKAVERAVAADMIGKLLFGREPEDGPGNDEGEWCARI